MAKLVISCEAGFSNDRCSIVIDNNDPIKFEDVNTDYSIGLAKKSELKLKKGRHRVTIDVSTRRLMQSLRVNVADTTYLRIWIDEGGNLTYKIDYQMPTYF